MALGKDYAYWTSRPVANTRNLTVNRLVEMFNFLIDNIYIQIGSAVYQQTIGIPMGTDCAPLVADLFLFSYEFEFMKSLIRTDLSVAAKFNNTCRYIDDLLTLNNPDFQVCIGQIYPPELELKNTTESHDSCSYLDLNINILNGKFYTDLYDKRDTFSFSIVNFPHMDSNIPSKPAYRVAISQLVRYLRICCNFAYRSKLLTTRLLRPGYVYQKLCSTYKTFVHHYPMTLQKYGRCLKNIITECIALPTVYHSLNMQLTWLDTFFAHTAFKHTLLALHCLPCALVTIYTSGASNTSVCARARTVYALITHDDQRLRSLRVRIHKIFERKTAARRDGAFRGVSTNFLNKASHLTAFYA